MAVCEPSAGVLLNGSMERLLDADSYLRNKIPEFASEEDFGLASGKQPDGTYSRVWFGELLPVDERLRLTPMCIWRPKQEPSG